MNDPSIARRTRGIVPATLVLVAPFLLATGACGDAATAPHASVPTELVLEAETLTVESLRETFGIQVRILDQNGREMSGVPLSWWVEDADVVVSRGASTFESVGNGETRIRAATSASGSHGGARLEGTAIVTVRQRPVALAIGPATGSPAADRVVRLWALGQRVDLSVWSVDGQGRPVAPVDAGLEWSSEDASIATSAIDGRTTAQGHGTTTVRASAAGLAGSVTIAVDARIPLEACARYQDGAESGEPLADEACGTRMMTVAEEGR